VKKKNKLRRKVKRHPNDLTLRNNYSSLCKVMEKKVEETKANYYDEKFSNCRGDIKKEWKLVNDILNKCQNKKGFTLF